MHFHTMITKHILMDAIAMPLDMSNYKREPVFQPGTGRVVIILLTILVILIILTCIRIRKSKKHHENIE